jgi:transcriptional antiterminator RfaH
MHWHLVHTKPRQEVRALENLLNQGYECYLPMLPTEKLRQGSLKVADVPLFPRYLFIRLGQGNSDQSWAPIRSSMGVNRLVSFGLQPARVDDELIDQLRKQQAFFHTKPERLFKCGDRVSLMETPFVGLEGIFKMFDGERRALVLIEILSKSVGVRVALASLCKAI